ncbi:MAG: hypothetical protein M3503_00540 [Actinomycetota bacterium]|nr:hypothetical protein [Actinomycetota bacterium]
MSNHSRLAQALVATGVAIAAVVGPATLASGQQTEPPVPRGMERMHELMREGNPGMKRMHELMREGNPGMKRMHSRMMAGDVTSSS